MLTLDRTHTLASLRNVKVVRPDNAGGQWQGVKHFDLVTGLIEVAGKGRNIKPEDVKIVLSRNDADMIGTIKLGGSSPINGTHLGFAASNAGRQCLRMYVGGVWNTVPLVMTEFGGREDFASWKYDTNFRLNDVCEEMCSIWANEIEYFGGARGFAPGFFDLPLNAREAASIVAEAAAQKIVQWNVAGRVYGAWKSTAKWVERTAGILMGLFAEHGDHGRPMDNLHNTLALGKLVMKKGLVPA